LWQCWWRSGRARRALVSRATDGRPEACSTATSRATGRRCRRAARRSGRHRRWFRLLPRRIVDRETANRASFACPAARLREGLHRSGRTPHGDIDEPPTWRPKDRRPSAATAARPRTGRSDPVAEEALPLSTSVAINARDKETLDRGRAT